MPDTGYQRNFYLNTILDYLGNKLIKVITGQRRSGKSYLLRQFINHLVTELKIAPVNIFYLNKEYIAFDEIQTANDLEQLFQYYRTELKP